LKVRLGVKGNHWLSMLNSVWATAKLLESAELIQFNGQTAGQLPQSDRRLCRTMRVSTIETSLKAARVIHGDIAQQMSLPAVCTHDHDLHPHPLMP